MKNDGIQKVRPSNDSNILHHHQSTLMHILCSDSQPPMDILQFISFVKIVIIPQVLPFLVFYWVTNTHLSISNHKNQQQQSITNVSTNKWLTGMPFWGGWYCRYWMLITRNPNNDLTCKMEIPTYVRM